MVSNYISTVSSQKELITSCQGIIKCQNCHIIKFKRMSRNLKKWFIILHLMLVRKKNYILSRKMSRNVKKLSNYCQNYQMSKNVKILFIIFSFAVN